MGLKVPPFQTELFSGGRIGVYDMNLEPGTLNRETIK